MHCVMKITAIISFFMVSQASASFFDDLQGAVLSVQTSFGKLFSDVLSEVKETVDSAISAVQRIMSSDEDKNGNNRSAGTTSQPNNVSTSLPKSQEAIPDLLDAGTNSGLHDLKKTLPAEINARIDETMSKVFNDYDASDRLKLVEALHAKESERLVGVNALVKQLLDKLPGVIESDLRRIEERNPVLSFASILDKVQLLQDLEENDKKSTEVIEIHQTINEVLDQLSVILAKEASEYVELEEIIKDMESQSKGSFEDLEKEFDEWKDENSEHLSEVQDEIEREAEIINTIILNSTDSLSEILSKESNYGILPIINSDDDNRYIDNSSTYNETETESGEMIEDGTRDEDVDEDLEVLPLAYKDDEITTGDDNEDSITTTDSLISLSDDEVNLSDDIGPFFKRTKKYSPTYKKAEKESRKIVKDATTDIEDVDPKQDSKEVADDDTTILTVYEPLISTDQNTGFEARNFIEDSKLTDIIMQNISKYIKGDKNKS